MGGLFDMAHAKYKGLQKILISVGSWYAAPHADQQGHFASLAAWIHLLSRFILRL